NTTDDLVSDINKLLSFLKIEKVILFGGSWGSTLALIYAIRYPEKVAGMILRGIFIPGKKDNKYFFGGGVKQYFPEVWERFISIVPTQYKKDPASYYFEKMKHGMPTEKEKYTYEWAYYESSLLKLKSTPKEVREDMKEFSYQSLSPLEAHYLLQNCFVPEGYIWKNIYKLRGIPTTIIHGRYDMICQPQNAYLLHKKLKKSKLFFVVGGHSDAHIKRKLIRETAKMYSKVSF
ncbi:MAG TPA: alpha/beta fold hydrolase, partial [Candidatus Saccharimonadales bacterium]|nr:alpha/beta fold hydrolase [Candidatus Saccharimonadales bacterium]